MARRNTGAVRQYTTDGILVKEHASLGVAADSVGCSPSLISKGCNRAQSVKTCKGFVWRYASNDEIAQGDMTAIDELNDGRRVRQYTMEGKLVKEYRNPRDAADTNGFNRGCIIASCNRYPSHTTSAGYVWRYADDDEIAKGDMSVFDGLDDRKAVRQYSLDGKFIKQFAGLRVASRETGIYSSSLSCCCNRKPRHSTAGGYIWRFVDDDEFFSVQEVSRNAEAG